MEFVLLSHYLLSPLIDNIVNIMCLWIEGCNQPKVIPAPCKKRAWGINICLYSPSSLWCPAEGSHWKTPPEVRLRKLLPSVKVLVSREGWRRTESEDWGKNTRHLTHSVRCLAMYTWLCLYSLKYFVPDVCLKSVKELTKGYRRTYQEWPNLSHFLFIIPVVTIVNTFLQLSLSPRYHTFLDCSRSVMFCGHQP